MIEEKKFVPSLRDGFCANGQECGCSANSHKYCFRAYTENIHPLPLKIYEDYAGQMFIRDADDDNVAVIYKGARDIDQKRATGLYMVHATNNFGAALERIDELETTLRELYEHVNDLPEDTHTRIGRHEFLRVISKTKETLGIK